MTAPALEALSSRMRLVRGPVAEVELQEAPGKKKGRLLAGIMVPFGQWTEINSLIEGHFVETFLPGSLDKTFRESRDRMRCILYHGKSGTGLGKMPIGSIVSLRTDEKAAYYEVELFEGLPQVLIEGLEQGEYGTSVKYELIVPDYRSRPPKSEHNPKGLDELRVVEAKVIEFGPTPFPVYEGAKAGLRSMTDDTVLADLAADPERLAAFAEKLGLQPLQVEPERAFSVGVPVDLTSNLNSTNVLPLGAGTAGAAPSTQFRFPAPVAPAPEPGRRYERALEFVGSAAWMLHPAMLATIVSILAERKAGLRPSKEELRERIGARDRADAAEPAADSPVQVIKIHGPLVPHAGMMADVSQEGRSVEDIRGELRAAVADERVNAVLLDVDSPGGSADLIPELAREIRDARAQKPIWAIANTRAASAGYYLASQADHLAVTPSGEVGSIGVYTVHDDLTGKLEQDGVSKTIISAGKYKVEGNPFEPLGEEAQAYAQERIDAIYKMFVADVARGRGATVKQVEADFGQGRMVMAEKAVEAGMADSVSTYDQILARLEKLKPEAPKARAAALEEEEPEPEPAASTPPASGRRTRSRNYLRKEDPPWRL